MKTLFTTLALFGLALSISAQEEQIDSLEGKKVVLDEVLVQAVRVTKEFPITFSDLDEVELAPRNLGQDIPILISYYSTVHRCISPQEASLTKVSQALIRSRFVLHFFHCTYLPPGAACCFRSRLLPPPPLDRQAVAVSRHCA